jgi:transposase
MYKHKEIIRLHEGGERQREISQIVHCSLRDVSKTLKASKRLGIAYEDLANYDEATVRQILFDPVSKVSDYYQPDFVRVDGELRVKGVNMALLWDEYARSCAAAGLKGYQYSQFCNLYNQWRKENGAGPTLTMRVSHVAGRLLEVDWAGTKAEYIDFTSGQVCAVPVFVGCLPFSQRIYVEAFADMTQRSWALAHVHNIAYNKGVTALIRPDNCKTGVVRADYFDPTINKDYAELAEHYGCAILPARPLKAKDKPSVENSVKFVETWVIAYLRDERFFSLGELNAAIFRRTAELNAQPFKGQTCSRDDVFWTEEHPSLAPLPATCFEPAEWKTAKVQMDYCIQVMRQRYSVPHRLVGQHVDVRVTDSGIEVFKEGRRICSHLRLCGRFNQCSIQEEHMPEAHKLYAEEWNPKRFKEWAASVGPSCLAVIDSILSSKPHPAQTYRACMGVMSFAKNKGNSFLEEICRTATSMSANPSYKQIKMLAAASSAPAGDASAIHLDNRRQQSIGDAGMVRGAAYYRVEDPK